MHSQGLGTPIAAARLFGGGVGSGQRRPITNTTPREKRSHRDLAMFTPADKDALARAEAKRKRKAAKRVAEGIHLG